MAYMPAKSEPMAEKPAAEPAESPESGEQLSAFAPMEFFGKQVKEGDTETVKITSVDPETGDVEFECVSKDTDYGGGKSMGEMFEEEVPEKA